MVRKKNIFEPITFFATVKNKKYLQENSGKNGYSEI